MTVPASARAAYNGVVNALTPDEIRTLRALLRRYRWAALATGRDAEPLASWVAVVPDTEAADYLLHLSGLALHTRYLQANPRASLAFCEPDDDPARDPQTLARVSLQGRMTVIESGTDDYAPARARYLAALPQAAVPFGLGDFRLLRFAVEHARFVPGFGRVHRLDRAALRKLS